MSNSKKPKTSKTILEKFRDYWDDWHSKWRDQVAEYLEPNIRAIKDEWLVPRVTPNKRDLIEILNFSKRIRFNTKEKNSELIKKINTCFSEVKFTETSKQKYYSKFKISQTEYRLKDRGESKLLPIHMAIPEPYWISKKIIDGKEPRAVFFNINPGPNKFYHLIDSKHGSNESNAVFNQDKEWENDQDYSSGKHNWSKVYNDTSATSSNNKPIYSEFINKLIDTYSDEKDFWHCKKRVEWVNEIQSNSNDNCELKDIVNLEFFPFHTNKAKEIKVEWIDMKKHIEFLLKPAIYLSQKVKAPELQNKIISRGNWQEGWKPYFEHERLRDDWDFVKKRIIIYPLKNIEGTGKGKVTYYLNICYTKIENGPKIFFLNFQGGGAAAPKMLLPSIESKQSICFIEKNKNDDKYHSLYFDKFMREIDRYIIS